MLKQAPEAARLTHQSLERGLRILEAVAASGGAATLAETARRTVPAPQYHASSPAGAGQHRLPAAGSAHARLRAHREAVPAHRPKLEPRADRPHRGAGGGRADGTDWGRLQRRRLPRRDGDDRRQMRSRKSHFAWCRISARAARFTQQRSAKRSSRSYRRWTACPSSRNCASSATPHVPSSRARRSTPSCGGYDPPAMRSTTRNTSRGSAASLRRSLPIRATQWRRCAWSGQSSE